MPELSDIISLTRDLLAILAGIAGGVLTIVAHARQRAKKEEEAAAARALKEKEMAESIQLLNKDYKETREELDSIRKNFADLNNKYKGSQEKIEELKRLNNLNTETIKRLQETLAAKDEQLAEMDELRASLDRMQKELVVLQNEHTKLSEQLKATHVAQLDAERERDIVSEKYKVMEQALSALKTIADSVNNQGVVLSEVK